MFKRQLTTIQADFNEKIKLLSAQKSKTLKTRTQVLADATAIDDTVVIQIPVKIEGSSAVLQQVKNTIAEAQKFANEQIITVKMGGGSAGGNAGGFGAGSGGGGNYSWPMLYPHDSGKNAGDISQKALIAEKRPEILVRNGKYFLINKPTLMRLRRDDQLMGGAETERILKDSGTPSGRAYDTPLGSLVVKAVNAGGSFSRWIVWQQ